MSTEEGERLTEKRMANSRFRRTEETIIKTFIEGDNYISVEQMAKKVGMARSTFYRHHKAVGLIIVDYRRYVLRRYARAVKKVARDSLKIKEIYRAILIFIIRNRNSFQILYRGGDRAIFEKMVDKVRKEITETAEFPTRSKRVFRVYRSGVVELMMEWGENDFKEAEVGDLLDKIVYLTDTARARLKKIES